MKKIIFLTAISVFLSACSGASTNVANTNANANTNTNPVKPVVATPAVAPATPATATPVVAPKSTGPKRISFGSGKAAADENVTLAAGATMEFVVAAKKGQFLVVEPNGAKIAPADLKVTVKKGKIDLGDLSEFLSGTLATDGDYVFEVKNTSKKELKFPLHIQIDDGPQ